MEQENIIRYQLPGFQVALTLMRTDDWANQRYLEWSNDQTTSVIRDSEFNVSINSRMPAWREADARTIEYFGITEIESDTLIGYCHIDKAIDDMAAWVSINIGDKRFRGKGYGQQAMRLMMHRIFVELGFQSIHLDVHENNVQAIKLYQKLGFQKTGVYRHHCYANREFSNWIHMDILFDEYRVGCITSDDVKIRIS